MRWQYKRVELDIAGVAKASFGQHLDRLGSAGWELVTAIQHARRSHSREREIHLLFKRAALDAALDTGELAAE